MKFNAVNILKTGLVPALVLSLALAQVVKSQDSALIPFTMTDQFDKVHTHVDYSDRILIIVGSDREGSKFNWLWGAAIRDSLESHPAFHRITFLGAADVRGIPGMLKGFLKTQFPKDRPVLMDWKGEFTTTYGLKPKYSNILVFAPKGKLICRVEGREVVQDHMRKIVESLRKILDNQSPS